MKRQDWFCRCGQILLLLGNEMVEIGDDCVEHPAPPEVVLAGYRCWNAPHQEKPSNVGWRCPSSHTTFDFIVEQLFATKSRNAILPERGGEFAPAAIPELASAQRARYLSKTECNRHRLMDSRDGASIVRWNPVTIRLQTSIARVSHGRPIGSRVSSSTTKTSAFVWSIWTTSRGRETPNLPGTAVVAFTIFYSPRRLARFWRSMSSRRANVARRCGGFSPADMQVICTSRTS